MCYAICINISYLLDIELLCVDQQCKGCCYSVTELGSLQLSTNYQKSLLNSYATTILDPGLGLIPTPNVLGRVDHHRCVGGSWFSCNRQ
jgi:hypothetical protein